jgi:hypothetical protein
MSGSRPHKRRTIATMPSVSSGTTLATIAASTSFVRMPR